MAPASNSAKALQQNRSRPAVPRAVVPAIPLPYIQKRQQQDAARAKAKEEVVAPTFVQTPTSSPSSITTNITPAIVNGSDSHAAAKTETSIEPASPVIPATPATLALEKESHSEVEAAQISAGEETTGAQTKIFSP